MEYLLALEEIKKLKREEEKWLDRIIEVQEELLNIARDDPMFRTSVRYEYLDKELKFDIPKKLETIREMLQQAKVIDTSISEFDGETVCIGAKVKLDYDGEEEMYTILPVSENKLDSGVISCNTPIAQQVIGRKVGDSFRFRECNVKILSVEKN